MVNLLPWNHWLFQLANSLLLVSYIQVNILFLRVVLTGASLCYGLWGYFILDVSPDTVLYNGLFCLINLAQVIMLLYDMRPIQFDSEDLEALYDNVFLHNISRLDFKKLCRAGFIRTLNPGSVYCDEGSSAHYLSVLLAGKLVVSKRGVDLNSIDAFSFLDSPQWVNRKTNQGSHIGVTIRAVEESRYLMWPRENLEALMMENGQGQGPFAHAIDSVIGRDIAQKLFSMNDITVDDTCDEHSRDPMQLDVLLGHTPAGTGTGTGTRVLSPVTARSPAARAHLSHVGVSNLSLGSRCRSRVRRGSSASNIHTERGNSTPPINEEPLQAARTQVVRRLIDTARALSPASGTPRLSPQAKSASSLRLQLPAGTVPMSMQQQLDQLEHMPAAVYQLYLDVVSEVRTVQEVLHAQVLQQVQLLQARVANTLSTIAVEQPRVHTEVHSLQDRTEQGAAVPDVRTVELKLDEDEEEEEEEVEQKQAAEHEQEHGVSGVERKQHRSGDVGLMVLPRIDDQTTDTQGHARVARTPEQETVRGAVQLTSTAAEEEEHPMGRSLSLSPAAAPGLATGVPRPNPSSARRIRPVGPARSVQHVSSTPQ